jgi:hypothetical protein
VDEDFIIYVEICCSNKNVLFYHSNKIAILFRMILIAHIQFSDSERNINVNIGNL